MSILSQRSWTVLRRIWYFLIALFLVDFGWTIAIAAYVWRTDELLKMLILSPLCLFSGAMLLWKDYVGPRPGDPK